MSLPLEETRILDLTRLLPGNYCTLLLSDLGAEVVKVEEPGRGDYIRWTPPLVGDESAIHRALNRGKRSVTLNLKAPEGVELLKRLVREANALIESFRPGVMDRLGVGYESLADVNPLLVYCSLTGYGQDGPYRHRVGHDINYTGYSGLLHNTGLREGPPTLSSVQVGDFGGAMAAAIGMLACLHEAARSRRGRFVDVSMLDVTVSWTGVLMSWYLATNEVPPRGGMPLGGGLACYRVYRAGDGRYVAVGALEPRFWRALCEAVGAPELIEEQFGPPDRQEVVAERLQGLFEARPRDAWVETLAGLEACVSPVNDIAETLMDPQVAHRGLIADVDGERVGPGPALKFSGHRARALARAPRLGEHTDDVLKGLGVSDAEIDGLRARGVI